MVQCMRVLSVEHLLPSASRDEQTGMQHKGKHLTSGSYSEAFRSLAYEVTLWTLLIPNRTLHHNA
jgi:hypothetical protein